MLLCRNARRRTLPWSRLWGIEHVAAGGLFLVGPGDLDVRPGLREAFVALVQEGLIEVLDDGFEVTLH